MGGSSGWLAGRLLGSESETAPIKSDRNVLVITARLGSHAGGPWTGMMICDQLRLTPGIAARKFTDYAQLLQVTMFQVQLELK